MHKQNFTPDNVELWISNWKRKEKINFFVKQWLDSFDFVRVNLVTNHSSVTIEDFDRELHSKIKIWNNVMRHDNSIGPMVENYNQSYVHTFLSGKQYCICAHDNMIITPGWDQIIKETPYEFYSAPQGDQIHIMSLEGLRTFGWWDERYATNGNHELDYITRALRLDVGRNKASMVDFHFWEGWPANVEPNPICRTGHPTHGNLPYLRWNDVGLDKYWIRSDKKETPQTGPKTDKFKTLKWNDKKWNNQAPNTFDNFMNGPLEEEIDWYPWLDINNLSFDVCAIK